MGIVIQDKTTLRIGIPPCDFDNCTAYDENMLVVSYKDGHPNIILSGELAGCMFCSRFQSPDLFKLKDL